MVENNDRRPPLETQVQKTQVQKNQAMKTPPLKTQVDDLSRGVYDIKDEVRFRQRTEKGLDEAILRRISEIKGEPEWMLDL